VWINPEKHKIVGEHLEATRKAAGVTQMELAKRLRKPQSFVSSYENGQRRVDLLEIASIVLALGGDPQVVCSGILDEILPPRRTTPKAGRGGVRKTSR
jgi:transcriptional regulator with XRE-family HTH domain